MWGFTAIDDDTGGRKWKMHEEIYPFHNIDIEYSYQFVSIMIGICATMSQYHTDKNFESRRREKKEQLPTQRP